MIPSPRHLTGATDDCNTAASEMALVHNCVLRALNSIYLQAPNVPASEHAHFVKYCNATFIGLAAHHDGEEAFFFPEIERITGEKGIMDVNVEQHKSFHDGFEEWGKWIQSIDAKKDTFDGAKCISLMDTFLPPLAEHLRAEIPTLAALSKYGDVLKLQPLLAEEGEKTLGGLHKTQITPVFFLNHDTTFEGGWHSFPPLPAPVRWVLRSLCGRRHKEWWQFSTVGFNGLPRELKYLG